MAQEWTKCYDQYFAKEVRVVEEVEFERDKVCQMSGDKDEQRQHQESFMVGGNRVLRTPKRMLRPVDAVWYFGHMVRTAAEFECRGIALLWSSRYI